MTKSLNKFLSVLLAFLIFDPVIVFAEYPVIKLPTKYVRKKKPPHPKGNHILNVYDAFGSDNPKTKHDYGFSAVVYWNGKTILFDGGSDAEILEKNTKALGVNLKEIDFAVGSHSHFNHINGFDYLLEVNPRVKIFLPNDPDIGGRQTVDLSGKDPSATDRLPESLRYFHGEKSKVAIKNSGRFWKARVEYVERNRKIAPGLHLIAAQSEPKELSLGLSSKKGATLVVGCSHSGINTIVKKAKEYLKENIQLVMGGYHLISHGEEEIRSIVSEMKTLFGVKTVAPAHCTGPLGFKVLKDVFGSNFSPAGLGQAVAMP